MHVVRFSRTGQFEQCHSYVVAAACLWPDRVQEQTQTQKPEQEGQEEQEQEEEQGEEESRRTITQTTLVDLNCLPRVQN
jgi:hypothetical protein